MQTIFLIIAMALPFAYGVCPPFEYLYELVGPTFMGNIPKRCTNTNGEPLMEVRLNQCADLAALGYTLVWTNAKGGVFKNKPKNKYHFNEGKGKPVKDANGNHVKAKGKKNCLALDVIKCKYVPRRCKDPLVGLCSFKYPVIEFALQTFHEDAIPHNNWCNNIRWVISTTDPLIAPNPSVCIGVSSCSGSDWTITYSNDDCGPRQSNFDGCVSTRFNMKAALVVDGCDSDLCDNFVWTDQLTGNNITVNNPPNTGSDMDECDTWLVGCWDANTNVFTPKNLCNLPDNSDYSTYCP